MLKGGAYSSALHAGTPGGYETYRGFTPETRCDCTNHLITLSVEQHRYSNATIHAAKSTIPLFSEC